MSKRAAVPLTLERLSASNRQRLTDINSRSFYGDASVLSLHFALASFTSLVCLILVFGRIFNAFSQFRNDAGSPVVYEPTGCDESLTIIPITETVCCDHYHHLT